MSVERVPTVKEIEASAWQEAEERWGPMGSPEDWESCGAVLIERLHAALARVAELEEANETLQNRRDDFGSQAHDLRAELSRLREGLREILYAWEGRAEEIPTIARRLLGEEK